MVFCTFRAGLQGSSEFEHHRYAVKSFCLGEKNAVGSDSPLCRHQYYSLVSESARFGHSSHAELKKDHAKRL